MLHKSHDLPHQKNTVPLWTQDEAIAFECAKEVIGDLMGICSGKIAKEMKKTHPDIKEINKLETERSALAYERSHLYLRDNVAIARLRSAYGKKVRAHRENQKVNQLNGNS